MTMIDGVAFLAVARTARTLIAEPAVSQARERSSALPGFTVGGLAAHLGAQVLMAAGYLSAPVPEGPVVSAVEHYARATWVDADRDADINIAIRDGGELIAHDGPASLLAGIDEALATLDVGLPTAAADRPVATPAGPWALPLGEALLTRAMEIAVHDDDLAASVGLPTPDLPDAAIDPVLGLLVVVAARRRGQPALLRALTRAERAPAAVAAFGPA